MTPLTEFVLARIAEDEHDARNLTYSPARQLAECEAKRRIVALHKSLKGDPNGEITDRVVYWCPLCDQDRDYIGTPHDVDGCPTLHALALPYAEHPAYRKEWALVADDVSGCL